MTRLLIAVFCLTCCTSCLRTPELTSSDADYPVGEFALTERSGRTVRNTDLHGKVWVASFVFTRCGGGCPQVTETMKRLQKDFARYPDVRLVTFTVDPDRDQPDDLTKYADRYQADPKRWLFLTGAEADVAHLLKDGFHLHAQKNPEGEPGFEIDHTFKLALVDRHGHIRGYYDGLTLPVKGESATDAEQRFEDGLHQLKSQVAALEDYPFPAFNATLNALATALILLGYVAVRRRLFQLHAALMLTALAVSTVFLTSYLYFHLVIREGQETHFQDQAPGAPPWVRYLYLSILISHVILAVLAAPMALFTAYQGLRGRLARHVRIARWTLPIWLYVSITGVVVYWMLYRLF